MQPPERPGPHLHGGDRPADDPARRRARRRGARLLLLARVPARRRPAEPARRAPSGPGRSLRRRRRRLRLPDARHAGRQRARADQGPGDDVRDGRRLVARVRAELRRGRFRRRRRASSRSASPRATSTARSRLVTDEMADCDDDRGLARRTCGGASTSTAAPALDVGRPQPVAARASGSRSTRGTSRSSALAQMPEFSFPAYLEVIDDTLSLGG